MWHLPFYVGWVSVAQPTSRKAMPFGGLRYADPPYKRQTPAFGTMAATPSRPGFRPAHPLAKLSAILPDTPHMRLGRHTARPVCGDSSGFDSRGYSFIDPSWSETAITVSHQFILNLGEHDHEIIAPSFSCRVHAHRIAGRDRDHRGLDLASLAGGSVGPRGRQAYPVREQSQADWPRLAQLS